MRELGSGRNEEEKGWGLTNVAGADDVDDRVVVVGKLGGDGWMRSGLACCSCHA